MKTTRITIKYSTGSEEQVTYRGNGKSVLRVIELAHRRRHWSHGVASIDGHRGVAAEDVYAMVTQASLSANPPHSLPVQRETIFASIRKLCAEPQNVDQWARRGSEKWLRAAVKAIIWPDGDAPVVVDAGRHVAAWSEGTRKATAKAVVA